jgi:hypothetical protein
MQVRLRLGDVNVHALIDSGSTHNLVTEKVASHTELPTVGCSSASVTMASGERVSCTGVYRRAPFSINDDQFSADFFMLPLPGYDVVPDTKWLATLGPILWDFAAFAMSFWHKDHLICWLVKKSAGTPPTTLATWEDIDNFIDCSPTFQLEDKLLVKGGGDVMWGRQYQRRSRARDAAKEVSKGAPAVVNDN